jgi:hypothetical protein
MRPWLDSVADVRYVAEISKYEHYFVPVEEKSSAILCYISKTLEYKCVIIRTHLLQHPSPIVHE